MNNKKPFLISLDSDLKEKIKELAKEDNRSITNFIEKTLNEKVMAQQESKQ